MTHSDKQDYLLIARKTYPLILQNLLNAAVSSADVLMLNYVGQASLSAVSLSSQYSILVLSMIFGGLSTGATVLCSQYYGKGDHRALKIVEGITLKYTLAVSILFAIMATFCPGLMMKVFTNDTELISIGSGYLRFVAVSYIFWGLSEAYLAVLRSMGRITTSMVINVMTFTLNVLLNAIFIFGLFGMPKMGASGVALATSISRGIEFFSCMLVSHKNSEVKFDLRYIFLKSKSLTGDFRRITLPAVGNDINWGAAFAMYSVIMGHMGSDVIAANSFVTVVRNFGTSFCYGIGIAGGVLLGQILGEGNIERARKFARKLVIMSVVTGIFGGLIVLASIPIVLNIARISAVALGYLKVMLLINTYYITGTALNTTLIVGVFRAGGDTKFGMICDTIDMWVYAVPLGFLAAFVFKLPAMVVYFLLCTDEFVKWPWVIKHYTGGSWLKNITREDF